MVVYTNTTGSEQELGIAVTNHGNLSTTEAVAGNTDLGCLVTGDGWTYWYDTPAGGFTAYMNGGWLNPDGSPRFRLSFRKGLAS